MKKYQKSFSFNTNGDASNVGNVCNLLYDICDWIVSLGIGFTSYRKENYDSSSERHFQCFLTHKDFDYEWCVELYSRFTFDSDGNITNISSGNDYTNLYFKLYSFGTYNNNINTYFSEYISAIENYTEYWEHTFQVTVYHFDDTNILFGFERTGNFSVEGFNNCTAMFLTSGENKFYTVTRTPLTSYYNSTNSYGQLTNGRGQTHMFKAILDSYNIKLSGKSMMLKVPVFNYVSQSSVTSTVMDYENETQLFFDRLFQTNKYVLRVGGVYTIDGADYLCINANAGLMIKC